MLHARREVLHVPVRGEDCACGVGTVPVGVGTVPVGVGTVPVRGEDCACEGWGLCL